MSDQVTILAICGSTKSSSLNMSLIKAIADLSNDYFNVVIFDGLSNIPHFNPDLDQDPPPAPVSDFRKKVREADGILICTPEYAMGVPGTLKNALDWTVSSSEFSHKPVALITASSQGYKGHQALLETLKVIEAAMTEETQLLISFVKTKVSSDNKIKDPKTLEEIMKLLDAFLRMIKNNKLTGES